MSQGPLLLFVAALLLAIMAGTLTPPVLRLFRMIRAK